MTSSLHCLMFQALRGESLGQEEELAVEYDEGEGTHHAKRKLIYKQAKKQQTGGNMKREGETEGLQDGCSIILGLHTFRVSLYSREFRRQSAPHSYAKR